MSSGVSLAVYGIPKPPPRLRCSGDSPIACASSAASAKAGPLAVCDRIGIQRLRSRINVKAAPIRAGRKDISDYCRDALLIDAKGFRAATHAHARAFQLEIRIDPDCEARFDAKTLGNSKRPGTLAFRLQVKRCTERNRQLEFGIALAGTGKTDMIHVGAAIARTLNSPPEAVSRPSINRIKC